MWGASDAQIIHVVDMDCFAAVEMRDNGVTRYPHCHWRSRERKSVIRRYPPAILRASLAYAARCRLLWR
ncbi:hypothetical protein KCP70_17650 [Salmonella enterica subsp. enterica]|nr:hypothetical protein KCP70_17650 [Salmonella enterica subsp. enterica]